MRRQKRNAIDNEDELEDFQIVYGQNMVDLLKLSEQVDELEIELMSASARRSRAKRESVDHIGSVITVVTPFIIINFWFVKYFFLCFSTGNSRFLRGA